MKIKMSYLVLSVSHFLLVGAAYALIDKLASNYLSLLDSGTLHTVLIAAMTVVIWLASSCGAPPTEELDQYQGEQG